MGNRSRGRRVFCVSQSGPGGRERPWAQIGQLTLQILNVKLKRPRPSYSYGRWGISSPSPAPVGMSACNETTLGHVGSLRQVAASPQSVRCGERPLTVTNGQTCSPARRISEPDRAQGEAFPCIQLSPSCRKTFSIPETANTLHLLMCYEHFHVSQHRHDHRIKCFHSVRR